MEGKASVSKPSRKVPYKDLSTISKVDFEEQIKLKLLVTETQSKTLADAIINAIASILISKKSLLLTGIGTLAVISKKSRMGRNPKNKEEFCIDERFSVTLRKGTTDTERLNKPEIIDTISKLVPNLPVYKVKIAFEVLITLIKSLAEGGMRIEIIGLGVFYPTHYPEREVRNPKTGEKIITPEKLLIRYRTSKRIKDEINVQ